MSLQQKRMHKNFANRQLILGKKINTSLAFSLYKKYMFFIGIAGQFMFFAQFYRIIQIRSAGDVSLFGFLCGLISVSSWLIYGLWIKDRVVIMANIVGTVGAVLAVIAILIYG